jgi:hypothetical protein
MFRSLVFAALTTPNALHASNDELADAQDRAAIMMTIRRLVDTLRRSDAHAAFNLLSDEFRGEMGSAKAFLASMRETCRPLCEARFCDFDTLSAVNGMLVQEIDLMALDGTEAVGYFLMERGYGDEWKIGSCIIEAQPTEDDTIH